MINILQFPPLMSTIFIAFIGYVIGKINPKLSSQLLNALAPEVLAQTGAFLDTLFNPPPPVIRNSRCLDQYAYRRYGGGDRDGDRACETI